MWPAIITPEQTEAIRVLLSDPERRTNRTARRYALAGMLRCGVCDTVLLAHPRAGVRRYVCKTGAGLAGCGKVYIDALRVEELITEGVLVRLDGPEAGGGMDGKRADTAEAWSHSEQIAQAQAQLNELAKLYGQREISVGEWKAARQPIGDRLKIAKQRLARAQQANRLDGLIGTGHQLRTEWSQLNLDRQRAIIGAVLDHGVVAAYTAKGVRRFDPDRVTPIWRS